MINVESVVGGALNLAEEIIKEVIVKADGTAMIVIQSPVFHVIYDDILAPWIRKAEAAPVAPVAPVPPVEVAPVAPPLEVLATPESSVIP